MSTGDEQGAAPAVPILSGREQVQRASPYHPVTVTVPQRRHVMLPNTITWLSPEDAPIHCCGTRNAYDNGYSNGNAWTREAARAAMEAECNERYILHEMGRHSEGAGVWTTPEGAVKAAEREYVERTALAAFWRAAQPVGEVPRGEMHPPHVEGFSAALGAHRDWHVLRLPTPYPLHAVLAVAYRREDTTGIVLGSAGGETLDAAVSSAMCGTMMILWGSRVGRPAPRRRSGFMRWASRATAEFLWPADESGPLPPEDIPAPFIYSRNGPYHFAQIEMADSSRMMLLDGYGDALG